MIARSLRVSLVFTIYLREEFDTQLLNRVAEPLFLLGGGLLGMLGIKKKKA